MSSRFEELDWQSTPMGELTLRRRLEPRLGVDIFEVKLGDEYLMSSLFTVAEEQLAHLGLALLDGDDLTVLVGGLGLGYTAAAALQDQRVGTLTVVDALPAVIDWHQRGLLPVSRLITSDPRSRLQLGDFFAMMRVPPTPTSPLFDAILVDIDHTPTHTLDPSHADLYTEGGLRSLARHLAPGGVFALWSDDPPAPAFLATLATVFPTVTGELITFDNPVTGGTSSNSVYLAR